MLFQPQPPLVCLAAPQAGCAPHLLCCACLRQGHQTHSVIVITWYHMWAALGVVVCKHTRACRHPRESRATAISATLLLWVSRIAVGYECKSKLQRMLWQLALKCAANCPASPSLFLCEGLSWLRCCEYCLAVWYHADRVSATPGCHFAWHNSYLYADKAGGVRLVTGRKRSKM